mgnify:CR=1 FL=1
MIPVSGILLEALLDDLDKPTRYVWIYFSHIGDCSFDMHTGDGDWRIGGVWHTPCEHLVNEKIFSALRRFRKTAEDRGVSMGSLAMAWALANPLTTAIITGPRRPEHLDMAEAALEIELSEDERTDLAATFTG